jgi:tartrate/fumarate subfamily iron-sulfur-dependent hydro-lyase beta chain
MKEKDVRELKAGDVVHINGTMVTGRDGMHMRALSSNDAQELNGATLYHCGPIMQRADGGWKVIAAGPTTSARMNSIQSDIIKKYNIRAVIGKGGMSDDVLETMRECGCVYLAAVGGAAVSLAEGLNRVVGVRWEDLGMAEAMWIFEAERFGPLVVAMDAHGNSIYKDVRSKVAEKIREIHSS